MTSGVPREDPQTGDNIDWSDFLNLLEGLKVTLPVPMNTHSSHEQNAHICH